MLKFSHSSGMSGLDSPKGTETQVMQTFNIGIFTVFSLTKGSYTGSSDFEVGVNPETLTGRFILEGGQARVNESTF